MKPLAFFFLAISALSLIPVASADEAKPNVIFILSDDHRWDRLGCAGHPILQTPTLDALAAEGTRFSNMFVTTSICAASRATIFTGLYERTHGYTFGTPPISKEHTNTSYPALMKKAGYRTGFVGKFGVGMEGQGNKEIFDWFHEVGRNPYFHKMPDGSLRHESEICGDEAIGFIKESVKDGPFCLSISFNAAHAEDSDRRPGIGHYPWPKAVEGLYEDIPMPEPRLSSPQIFEAHPQFLKDSMNRDRYYWRWDTPEKFQTNLRAYYRMITGLDKVIGRVRSALDELGVAENTVIVFAGDNGYYEGQRGFAGKWSHYEESLRVPLIIFDPRVEESNQGQVCDLMVLNADIAPTILEYGGVSIPEVYQGRGLKQLVEGADPAEWREDTFVEHLMDHPDIPKWEGVRDSRYVYARYFEQDPPFEFLHDLEKDPDELTNLVTDPASEEILEKMRSRTNQLRDSYGGPFDVTRVRKWKEEQAAKRKAQKAKQKAKSKQ
ncbi:MAG: mucin-desulfating sulfatase [Verrucomicrobiales bacterium]|nr:mucin-desulfating sulfatase [Verrucomicrobiales bacterium]